MLVTGIGGFIGFHVARRLLDEGHDVVGIDNMNHYYDVRLKLARLRELGLAITDNHTDEAGIVEAGGTTLRFLRLDVTDATNVIELFAAERFDAVCHLAAQAGVRYSLSDPDAYVTSNVYGALSILEGARHHPVGHVVYASSSSVYGLDRTLPFSESGAADHPVSLYAATKRANELMAHSYSHLFGVPTTGLRFFTVYGPWGRPDMALFLFTKAILSGEPIDLFNGGDMRRDFTYVDDTVEAVVRILQHPPQGVADWDGRQSSISPAPARVYNVGNGSPVELRDLVSALEDELGIAARVRSAPMQPGDVTGTWADCSALQQAVGFKARVPIREGVHRFLAWYREHYPDR